MSPTDSTVIASLSAKGLHGHQDVDVSFRPGLNVVHGKNGSGKTTLLHLLANLISRDIERFCHIRFRTVTAQTVSGRTVRLYQAKDGEKRLVQIELDGKLIGEAIRPSDALKPEVEEELAGVLGRAEPVYLPAFRSILEAITRRERYHSWRVEPADEGEFGTLVRRFIDAGRYRHRANSRENAEATAYKTLMCRKWFGPFVPPIRYPSLWDVSRELQEELEAAYLELARTDQSALSSVFVDVLDAVFQPASPDQSPAATSKLLERVRASLSALNPVNMGEPNIYERVAEVLKNRQSTSIQSGTVRAVLEVYERVLSARAYKQSDAFGQVNGFVFSVNEFLEHKKLAFNDPLAYTVAANPLRRARLPSPVVAFPNDVRYNLDVLSSGERHVLTMLFSATHMSKTDGMVLIDEPELSLHVDWQRIILSELASLAGDRQIVACTHSPEVAAEHRDRLVRLSSRSDGGDGLFAGGTEPIEEAEGP